MDVSITVLVVEGLRLMAIGMSIVFVFLLLLVGVLTLMSKLIARYVPEPGLPAAVGGERFPAAGDTQNEEIVAVIATAVARYRATHRSP